MNENRQVVADDGFTGRVMERIPRADGTRAVWWLNLVCALLIVAVFFAFGGTELLARLFHGLPDAAGLQQRLVRVGEDLQHVDLRLLVLGAVTLIGLAVRELSYQDEV